MSFIKVSIIIPVYNAEKYIDRCIHSLINQTLREIEIIIVNDGSTDASLKIVSSLAIKDERIKIIDKRNGGVGAARNSGIKAAKGEFIGFVDADDWAETNMYETLYNKIKETESDFAICNVNGIEDGKIVNKRLNLETGIIDFRLNKSREITNFLRFKYDNANWNKLYNTWVIKKNVILFNEKMSVWEDLLFNLYYIQFINRAVIIDETLYNYMSHPNSVMRVGNADIIREFNLLYEDFLDFTLRHNLQSERDTFRKVILENCYTSCITWALNNSKTGGNSFIKSVKLFSKEIKRINSDVFAHARSEAKGIKRIKENLLYNRQYNLFSISMLLRSYFD